MFWAASQRRKRPVPCSNIRKIGLGKFNIVCLLAGSEVRQGGEKLDKLLAWGNGPPW